MHSLFSDVLWIVLGLGILAAIWAMAGSSKEWQRYGERGLFMESERERETPAPSAAVAAVERESEIRQMVEAANARRARRGEAQLDVQLEMDRLTADSAPSEPAERQRVDPEVEDEIRTLVQLRNLRRIRKGQEPMDVEAEIQRELAALGMTNR